MGLTVPDLLQGERNYGDNKILVSSIQTPLGEMLALATVQGICLLEFSDRKGLEVGIQTILEKTNSRLIPGKNHFSNQLSEDLAAYFKNPSHLFSVPLVIFGTEFQKSVWKALSAIPIGETRTYSQVARVIGKPQAARAVGHANARNPIAIVIPCHRLIGTSGNLTGYGGGIWRKEWLLHHEKIAGKSDKD